MTSLSPPKSRQEQRRLLRRLLGGFTITELMVAITGGLIISIAVFLLARQASRFYQHEARISTATMASIVGFERLRADIARAGFLASPNVRKDPAVCNGPVGNPSWPGYLSHLQSIWIQPITGLDPSFAANGLAPQSITMSGSYASPDQFEVAAVLATDEGVEVYLNPNGISMLRNCAPDAGVLSPSCLQGIFGTGRAVRIVDTAGRHHYGTIVQTLSGPPPRIVLSATPLVGLADSNNPICGIRGTGQGSLINVVNIVRYNIRSLDTDPNYAAIYIGGPPYEGTRRELVRDELDVTGEPIEGTTELISEYAVDLGFQLTVPKSNSPQLETVGGPNIELWAGDTSSQDNAITGPQLVRAVRATLSVRSREADRRTGLDGGVGFRVGLGGAPGGPPFARVRSVDALIALNSQLGVTWQ